VMRDSDLLMMQSHPGGSSTILIVELFSICVRNIRSGMKFPPPLALVRTLFIFSYHSPETQADVCELRVRVGTGRGIRPEAPASPRPADPLSPSPSARLFSFFRRRRLQQDDPRSGK